MGGNKELKIIESVDTLNLLLIDSKCWVTATL